MRAPIVSAIDHLRLPGTKTKRRKDVKLNTWTVSLACLTVFALFAVSTPAQNQALQLPSQIHAAQALNGDASDVGKIRGIPKSDGASSDATDTCTYTFTSGSGATYLKFCVTVNGNLAEFQSPAGVEQLDQNGGFEGYGICDSTSSTQYYDYGYEDSGNWAAPTTISHTATEVKIERTTSDGSWTLTQTITSVAGTNPYAKVAMALKNNSAATKAAALLRWASPVPDNGASSGNFNEYYDGSQDSAWGYIPIGSTSGAGHYGLMIQNVGNPTPASALFGREGIAQDIENAPGPCNPSANMESPVINDYGSTVYYYILTLNKEQTVTVTDRYMSF
jgi:hypothetical protein